jgi:hypothetical protein
MKTIYIDEEYKCHVANDTDEYIAVETEVFDGKCDAYIEGYRFIPAGKTWSRGGGIYIQGEAIMPWKRFEELQIAQEEYEAALVKEYKESLKILGVSL